LTQIFSNLLSNSAKYTERGGQIYVTAERQGESVMIRVRDTGVGIPPEMLTQVFEMFAQVDSSLGRAGGGLGIGLSLVKQLVEMHNGRISATSPGMGQGSEFTVQLPLLVSEANNVAKAPAHDYSGRALEVVVADDNVDAARTLAMLLRKQGHHVHIVHDGQQAVQAVVERHPDLAILDIGMPVLSGYEAAARIREELGPRDGVYLAALTGWGQEEDRRRALDAGFDAHVVKPVEASRLNAILDAAAHHHSHADESAH
jgi:CheY-like chemotaxis protein